MGSLRGRSGAGTVWQSPRGRVSVCVSYTFGMGRCPPSHWLASSNGRLSRGSCRSIVALGATLPLRSSNQSSLRSLGHHLRSCCAAAQCARPRCRVSSCAALRGFLVRTTILGIVKRFGRCRLQSIRAPLAGVGVSSLRWCLCSESSGCSCCCNGVVGKAGSVKPSVALHFSPLPDFHMSILDTHMSSLKSPDAIATVIRTPRRLLRYMYLETSAQWRR